MFNHKHFIWWRQTTYLTVLKREMPWKRVGHLWGKCNYVRSYLCMHAWNMFYLSDLPLYFVCEARAKVSFALPNPSLEISSSALFWGKVPCSTSRCLGPSPLQQFSSRSERKGGSLWTCVFLHYDSALLSKRVNCLASSYCFLVFYLPLTGPHTWIPFIKQRNTVTWWKSLASRNERENNREATTQQRTQQLGKKKTVVIPKTTPTKTANE